MHALLLKEGTNTALAALRYPLIPGQSQTTFLRMAMSPHHHDENLDEDRLRAIPGGKIIAIRDYTLAIASRVVKRG